MGNKNLVTNEERITALLQENLRLTKQIDEMLRDTREMTQKIKHYLVIMRVASFVKFLIIIAPLILGFIYLPSLLDGLMTRYKRLFPAQEGGLQGLDLTQILNALK